MTKQQRGFHGGAIIDAAAAADAMRPDFSRKLATVFSNADIGKIPCACCDFSSLTLSAFVRYAHFKEVAMPSFDVVSEANLVEVKNAVDQAGKEIGTRFDFKGSDARVEQKERDLTAYADSDFQLSQVRDVLTAKLVKRNVDVRFLDIGKIEKIGGDKVKQVIKIKNGIESDAAKKIVRIVKDSKMKVQASIQGEAVRITGAKRDDLQAAMAMLRKEVADLPLEFNNFRD
jgi:uncharacterized protein YajQ (UPF0234 family)